MSKIFSYFFIDDVTTFFSLLTLSILILCCVFAAYSVIKYCKYADRYKKEIESDNLQGIERSSIICSQGLTVLCNFPDFIRIPPSRSKIRYFTTVLTSLGVLGTFVGIIMGLADIDKKLAGDINHTFSAVRDLLGGMQTAFVTSIVGMVASLILLIFLLVCEKITLRRYAQTRSIFLNKYRQETLGDYLSKLTGDGQQELITKQLEVAEKSAQASGTLLSMGLALQKSAENFDADKIGQYIAKSLDVIFKTEMVPLFIDIRNELGELKEIKQDSGEKIIKAIKDEIITPLTDEIKHTATMVNRSAESIDNLNQELGGITGKLADAVMTIQSFQQETLSKLQIFAIDLRQILSGFQMDTKIILDGVTESLKGAVEASISAMSTQRDAFKSSAEDAATTFKGIRSELEQALSNQAQMQQALLNTTADRFNDVIKESLNAFDKQGNIIHQIGQTASNVMNSSKENLEGTLKNIEQSLLNTKHVVEQELESFRFNYQESLTKFFNEQNNLLEQTLGSQRNGLAQVVENCHFIFVEEYDRRKQLSEQLGTNFVEMQQAVDTVSNLVQSVRMLDAAYVTTIEQAAGSLGRQAAGMEKQHQTTQQILNQFMTQVPEALNSYFNKANESHVKFFTSMDEAATRIHQRLLQSAEYLVSAQINRHKLEMDEVN